MAVKIVNPLANLLSPYFEGDCATHILLLTSYVGQYEYVNLDMDEMLYWEKRNVIIMNELRTLLRCW